jgi:TrpR family trp operon transcriptional repressor
MASREAAGCTSHAENIKELSVAFARTGDERQIAAYFQALLTPGEIAAISSRWALVKALHEKEPQREIAKNLGVSLCKITRGSRELKKQDSAFLKMFAILDAEEQGQPALFFGKRNRDEVP